MVDKKKLKSTDLKCVWNMGSQCSEDVYDVEIFANTIKVPVCGNHLDDHEHVMVLHRNGYDVEEVISKSPEYRREEVLVIKLSGLDKKDNDEEQL